MSTRELFWPKAEKQAARTAYEAAYRKECAAIVAKAEALLRAASQPADVWRVHDFLTTQRDATDEKYDYRYIVLLFILARLLKEGWLVEGDLDGLSADKAAIITHLAARSTQHSHPPSPFALSITIR